MKYAFFFIRESLRLFIHGKHTRNSTNINKILITLIRMIQFIVDYLIRLLLVLKKYHHRINFSSKKFRITQYKFIYKTNNIIYDSKNEIL